MQKIIIFIVLFLVLGFGFSCKNKKSENQEKTDLKKKPELKYNADSASESAAVLVFGNDGKVEYVEGGTDKAYQKTKSGLEYRIITKSKSKLRPKIGDVIFINMSYKTESDSILFKTSDIDKNFKMRLTTPSHEGGCIEEAFLLMYEGDSAAFRIDAYNFFTYTQGKVNLPKNIKKGDKLIFNIKMLKIVSDAEYVMKNKDMYAYYINQEDSHIERYILNFEYPAVKTESGLRIMTIKQGSGKKVTKGQKVQIHYTAGFIDGGVFDSSLERNQAFEFVVGENQVIEGLEEGVSKMNVGGHAILIIPFRLAYGEEKYGIIPPFSTLVFEIDLLDAK
jgi:FKBP-type peptidyl-prolyl cis-trans isomerase